MVARLWRENSSDTSRNLTHIPLPLISDPGCGGWGQKLSCVKTDPVMNGTEGCLVEWCADRIDMTGRGRIVPFAPLFARPPDRRELTCDTECFIKAEQTERKAAIKGTKATLTWRKSLNKSGFLGKWRRSSRASGQKGSFDARPKEENLCESTDTTPARDTLSH